MMANADAPIVPERQLYCGAGVSIGKDSPALRMKIHSREARIFAPSEEAIQSHQKNRPAHCTTHIGHEGNYI